MVTPTPLRRLWQGYRDLFLRPRFFLLFGAVVLVLVLGYYYPPLFGLGKLGLLGLGMLTALDIMVLFAPTNSVRAWRETPERLSNGDENELAVVVESTYPVPIQVELVDEIPAEFQVRDFYHRIWLRPRKPKKIGYTLRPTRRGTYRFGTINVFAVTPLGLANRRFRRAGDQVLPVYPSYVQMRKYQLIAVSNRFAEFGLRKIRRVGHTMEFDQIRDYVRGDDVRSVNWRATARAQRLMVNTYQDERSQQVYCVLDIGRNMRAPFDEMTLLDHAINTSLVLANTAVLKDDKAGLLTFSHRLDQFLDASKRRGQMRRIQELLYAQQTRFLESDFAVLYSHVRQRIPQRSLLIVFTNFETVNGVRRQLPYLRKLALNHLVLVVFFENTYLRQLTQAPAEETEAIYIKTIAEKFAYEKQQVVKELQQHGVHTLLTPPRKLTVNTLNKYLEFKARGLI